MSSAARALGRAAMCARALRVASSMASDDEGASFRHARDELAGTLRNEALRVFVVNGIPAQAREDLAQAVTLTVLNRIVDGAVEPGFEDGYLAVAAKNRARDWHREKSGVYEKTEVYEEDILIAPGLDPHAALERAEEEKDVRALTDRVVSVLEKAPPRYRDVLVAVYLEGVPIDALVEKELFREWPCLGSESMSNGGGDSSDGDRADNDPIATRRRARARVDKLLQRARDWVRVRMLAAKDDATTTTTSAMRTGDPR